MSNKSPFHVSVILVGNEDERRESYIKALQHVIAKYRGDVRNEKSHYIHQGVNGRTGGERFFYPSPER